MKRISAIFMLIALVLTASGCQKRTRIGLCMRQTEDDPAIRLESELENRFREKEYMLISRNANSDQSRQNRQIEEILDEGCDILIVEPVMTAAAGDILRKAQNTDVPVIFLNYEPEETVLNTWDRAYYIGSRMNQPGLLQSRLIGELPDGGDLNADGNVTFTVISGPEDHVDASRWTQDCGKGLSGKRLSVEYGDWSRESGRQLYSRQLAQFGSEIEVIFCNSDEMALGALEALQSGEKTVGENVYLVAIGAGRQALTRIQEGNMTGTISPDTVGLADCITDTVDRALSGGQPEKVQLLDFVMVTAENVELFLR